LRVRLVFIPLPRLLFHELFLTILPALLRFLCARSVTAWGRLIDFAEEALKPHCKHDAIRAFTPEWDGGGSLTSKPFARAAGRRRP
jgi:hypothetical protein